MMDYMISEYKWRYGSDDNSEVNYEMLNPIELLVTMRDSKKYIYNDYRKSIRLLPANSMNLTDEQIIWEFCFRLKSMLEQRGMTQKELSMLTGISEHTISKYMSFTGTPNFINLDKICKALNCSADDFRYL